MIEAVGYFVLILSLLGAGYLLFFRKRQRLTFFEVALFALIILAAITLILSPRVSELEVFKVARLKLQEVKSDAHAIREVRKELEGTSKRVASIEQAAMDRLNKIEVVQRDAEAKLAELDELSSFNMLLTKASNDDRKSVEELFMITSKSDHKFYAIARDALETIRGDVARANIFGEKFPWKEGKSLAGIPYNQLDAVYNQQIVRFRLSLLNEIWSSPHYSKYEKLDFLSRVIRNSNSTRELERACQIMDDEAKINRNFLGSKEYLIWWDQHKEQYKKAVDEKDNP